MVEPSAVVPRSKHLTDNDDQDTMAQQCNNLKKLIKTEKYDGDLI